jgi:hypothetical protein
MTLTAKDFCPNVDALTLLQFRSEAFQTWREAPANQDATWLDEYGLIADLLEQAGGGPIKLLAP